MRYGIEVKAASKLRDEIEEMNLFNFEQRVNNDEEDKEVYFCKCSIA